MSFCHEPPGLAIDPVGAQQEVKGDLPQLRFPANATLKVDIFNLRLKMDFDLLFDNAVIEAGNNVVSPMRVDAFFDRCVRQVLAQDSLMNRHPEEFRALSLNRLPRPNALQDLDRRGREDDRESEAVLPEKALLGLPFEKHHPLKMVLQHQCGDHPIRS